MICNLVDFAVSTDHRIKIKEIIVLRASFSHQRYLMVSQWSLSGSKSLQVSRTLLGILAVVWMVSTRPLISKFSSPFNKPLGIVPSAPITIDIPVTCSIFQFSSKVLAFIFLLAFFQFYPVISQNGKVLYSEGSLFFIILLLASFSQQRNSLNLTYSKLQENGAIFLRLINNRWKCLIWFGLVWLTAYKLIMGYLMPKYNPFKKILL